MQVDLTLHMTSIWQVVVHWRLWLSGHLVVTTTTRSFSTSSTTTRPSTSRTGSPKELERLHGTSRQPSVCSRGLTTRLVSRLATRLGSVNGVRLLRQSAPHLSRSRIKIHRTSAPLVVGPTNLSLRGRYVLATEIATLLMHIHLCTVVITYDSSHASAAVVDSINIVTLCWARSVPGWVTILGLVNSLGTEQGTQVDSAWAVPLCCGSGHC